MGLRVGQYVELHRKYTQADVNAFCEVSGDYNPVHSSRPVCDDSNVDANTHDYHTQHHQQLQPDSRSIVHGVLLTSIFSTIFGTLIPGCMYRSQSFKFYHPVYVDEEVFGHVIVTRLRQINNRDSNNDNNNINTNGCGVLCKCDTTIYKKIHPCSINSNEEIVDMLCIDGEAQVWIPNSTLKDD
jgi:acyl dehydratase